MATKAFFSLKKLKLYVAISQGKKQLNPGVSHEVIADCFVPWDIFLEYVVLNTFIIAHIPRSKV